MRKRRDCDLQPFTHTAFVQQMGHWHERTEGMDANQAKMMRIRKMRVGIRFKTCRKHEMNVISVA